MDQRFIMTAFGKDRPGIVADVTRVLFENGCNLEDNSMTLLADEFTLILLFTAKRGEVEEQLARDCRRLEREKGISAFLRPLEARQGSTPAACTAATLHVEGMDQAGIVFKVSQFLADHGINIIDLKSAVLASPESGAAIYRMDIAIQIPVDTAMAKVEAGLTAVAEELHVEISLARQSP
jgi:glycine cleavage system transcriptional repressor